MTGGVCLRSVDDIVRYRYAG